MDKSILIMFGRIYSPRINSWAICVKMDKSILEISNATHIAHGLNRGLWKRNR